MNRETPLLQVNYVVNYRIYLITRKKCVLINYDGVRVIPGGW
jgi:hypothetical protein